MATIDSPAYLTIRIVVDGLALECNIHAELNGGCSETQDSPGEAPFVESVWFDDVAQFSYDIRGYVEPCERLERWMLAGLQHDYRTNPVFEAQVDAACLKALGGAG